KRMTLETKKIVALRVEFAGRRIHVSGGAMNPVVVSQGGKGSCALRGLSCHRFHTPRFHLLSGEMPSMTPMPPIAGLLRRAHEAAIRVGQALASSGIIRRMRRSIAVAWGAR